MAVIGTWPKQLNDLDLLHPNIKVLALKLQAESAAIGIPIRFTETLRTKETQQEYYSWGRTKINPNTKKMTKATGRDGVQKPSNHQFGLAFDIVINIKGKSYDPVLLKKVGAIGKKLGLLWGGDAWPNLVDMPHFEKTYGLSLSQLKAGARPKVEEDELIMAKKPTDKEIAYGKSAINEMAKDKVINSPEVHYDDLNGYLPAWKMWTVQNNIRKIYNERLANLEKEIQELKAKVK